VDWSNYNPPKPSFTGTKVIDAIPVKTVRRYLNWRAFLAAWKFPAKYGKYMQLNTQEEKQNWLTSLTLVEKKKAEEAIRLLKDAQNVLDEWSKNDPGFIKAVIGFYRVEVMNDSLVVKRSTEANKQYKKGKEIIIPLLRQQEKRDDDIYKSLADYFHPKGDFIGFFAATAGRNTNVIARAMDRSIPVNTLDCFTSFAMTGSIAADEYSALLHQLLRDRLVEAASEYLHESVRKKEWGYVPDESFTSGELLKAPYRGIRPASGYPSLPDLSLNFVLDELLEMKKIDIHLTPNGAMEPSASVAGIYLSHPESDYFMIGKIDNDQLTDYATRKGESQEEAKKWVMN
jgi:5-methyltetrahydrofolate--homocysteine methyltransferase